MKIQRNATVCQFPDNRARVVDYYAALLGRSRLRTDFGTAFHTASGDCLMRIEPAFAMLTAVGASRRAGGGP